MDDVDMRYEVQESLISDPTLGCHLYLENPCHHGFTLHSIGQKAKNQIAQKFSVIFLAVDHNNSSEIECLGTTCPATGKVVYQPPLKGKVYWYLFSSNK